MAEEDRWRRCSACKGPIGWGSMYWTCNVSTCNRKRTGLVFCSVSCWEVHLPSANHRESWAVENTAPLESEAEAQSAPSEPARAGRRRIVSSELPKKTESAAPDEVLIIASRLKAYVRAKSGFNTSSRVLEPLSDIIREVCDRTIENARREGRTTVLDRDVPKR